jgi:uncharacterized protein with NRDE domain
MCLIVFAINHHPDYPLILAANRDEFYARPTIPAAYWQDLPQLIGGRDQQAGGTWMALHIDGRMAAVTNYRDLKNLKNDAKSRGELPVNYLLGTESAEVFLQNVLTEAHAYNGFNLLLYEDQAMHHYSNYEGKINRISAGIHGVSNALLDTPWPKVNRLKEAFTKTISGSFSHESLLDLLTSNELAPDDQLPDTGVGYDLEKMLSAICIRSENYGTCSSSVLTVAKSGEILFTERTYPVGGRKAGEVSFSLRP